MGTSGGPGTRRTFVVQVHDRKPATVENVLTRERVAVPALTGIPAQIEAWLAVTKKEGR
jgi:hypothetical protein